MGLWGGAGLPLQRWRASDGQNELPHYVSLLPHPALPIMSFVIQSSNVLGLQIDYKLRIINDYMIVPSYKT